MRALMKNNWIMLGLYFLLVLMVTVFLLNYGKIQIHVYLNQLVGNKIIDQFFYFITFLGDGAVAPVLLVLITIYNVRLGLVCTVSFLVAGLSTWLIKNYLFHDVMRPYHVFQWTIHSELKLVDSEHVHTHRSFPSGHSTQAFAILLCLAFYVKSNLNKLLFLFIAVLVAFSRVYLSQHWLVDVTVGSIVGAVTAMFFYYLLISRNKMQSLNRPVFKLRASESSAQ